MTKTNGYNQMSPWYPIIPVKIIQNLHFVPIIVTLFHHFPMIDKYIYIYIYIYINYIPIYDFFVSSNDPFSQDVLGQGAALPPICTWLKRRLPDWRWSWLPAAIQRISPGFSNGGKWWVDYLVGGWKTPLKNMSSSVGMMTFPIYGTTTSQLLHTSGFRSI